MTTEGASTLENLINAYIYRALLSADHLEEVCKAFGGLDVESSADGRFDRVRLAHSIAQKILRSGWYYEVVGGIRNGLRETRVVITGRS